MTKTTIDIFINGCLPFEDRDLDLLAAQIERHAGVCEVLATVDQYDTRTKGILDRVARVCRAYGVAMACQKKLLSFDRRPCVSPRESRLGLIYDSRMKTPRVLTGRQRDAAGLLSMVTDGASDWQMYAYRLCGGVFGVTDGARVMTLDLSGIVPSDVMAFDPHWALISDYPWDCPMTDGQMKEYAAQIREMIPSTEGYDVSGCRPFRGPKAWADFNDARHIIRAKLEAYSDYSDKGLSVSIRVDLHKIPSRTRYCQPVDLRLLSPMAGARVTWHPYVGSKGGAKAPLRFSFTPFMGHGCIGSLIVMPAAIR
jgi:hypothetical protein